ncbi:hypothetical protein H0W80_03500 [Candidatus Saccharibacteria bacterium]|nr:hypothetical protein [Candidatus Saccharibacteria bacterium]
MKKVLIIFVVILGIGLLAGGGYFGYKKWVVKKNPQATQQASQQQNSAEPNQEKVVKRQGTYEQYDPAKFILATDGKVVLFFNAKWSATSKQLDKDFKNTKLPDNFTVMSVDYDKNALLRKKYTVPFENTFVQVDAQGTMINRWSGSEDVSEVIALTK